MVKCNKKDTESSCRSFKVVWSEIGYVSPPSSYFRGKSVSQVATKFGTRLFKLATTDPKYKKFANQEVIKVMIKETTRGAKDQTAFFKAKKVPLATPLERTFPNGNTVTITHRTIVTRCTKDFVEQ
jgi:hypothetical protein